MHDKNPNVQTLNFIYRSGKAGVDSIGALIPKVDSPDMKKDLASQMLGYHNFIKKSSQSLYEVHHYPHEANPIEKLPAYANLCMRSLIDSSDSNIAEMMIEGSTMGIIEMQRMLNRNNNLPEESKNLGNEIIEFERNNIDTLRGYL